MTTSDPSTQATLAGMAYGTASALIWALWPIVSRLGVTGSLDPFDVTFLRFSVAGLVLLPFVLGWLAKGAFQGVTVPRALCLSAFAGAPYVLVSVGGLTFAPAGHAGVLITSVMLSTSTMGAWLIMGDRPGPRRLAGVVIILVGIGLVGSAGLHRGGGQAWMGDLMFVAGGMLWASFTVFSRAWAVPPLQATALVAVVSMIVFCPAYLFVKGPDLMAIPFQEAPWGEILLQAGFQGVAAAIGALFLYSRSLSLLGPAKGAIFAAITPATAVMLAWPILGEVPTCIEFAGLTVVSCGMVFALGLHRLIAARWRRPAG